MSKSVAVLAQQNWGYNAPKPWWYRRPTVATSRLIFMTDHNHGYKFLLHTELEGGAKPKSRGPLLFLHRTATGQNWKLKNWVCRQLKNDFSILRKLYITRFSAKTGLELLISSRAGR